MGKTYCPACGSEEVEMDDEGLICSNCGYKGDFPEKHVLIEGEEDDEDEEVLKSIKKAKAAKNAKSSKTVKSKPIEKPVKKTSKGKKSATKRSKK